MRIKSLDRPGVRVFSLLTLLAMMALGSQRSLGQTEVSTADGLVTANFKTPQGTVQLNLPDNASGPVSGSLRAFPAGQTAEEKAKNLDTLNTFVIRMHNQDTRVAAGAFRRTIVGGNESVSFLDKAGREVSRAALRISPPIMQPCGEVMAPQIVVPRFVQAGRSLSIRGVGVFDGNSTTTSVKINGQQAQVLGESLNNTVVECPTGVAGPSKVELKKNQVETQTDIRVLGVDLTAPDLNLRTGQQTTLTTQVKGVGNLQEDLSFRLQNQTPAVVQMAGGENQNITIHPQDVQGDSYTCTRVLTGKQPGGFNVSATVHDSSTETVAVTSADEILVRQSAPTAKASKRGGRQEYFLPSGMVELDPAIAQQQWASPNIPGRNPCCCCCCGPLFGGQRGGGPGPGPGPGPAPNPSPGSNPIMTNVNLAGSIHVFAVPVTPINPMGYFAEAHVQWNVSGGSGQLTVDVDVQRPGSTRWEKLVTGRGPNDEYLFSTGVAGTYLFRVTGKDSAGNSNFNTLSVTFPCIPGINCH